MMSLHTYHSNKDSHMAHPFKKTTAQFIEEARAKHGDLYSYEHSRYLSANEKLQITCPQHGEFWQSAYTHLKGSGCPKCKGSRLKKRFSKTTEQYIQEAREVHGDRYDYSRTQYKGAREHVTIICPTHGEFSQHAGNHLRGFNCPGCGNEARRAGRLLSQADFIARCTEVHNGVYSYDKVVYVGQNNNASITITCPIHGDFNQLATVHVNGAGCPECGTEATAASRRHTIDDFIRRAETIHSGKYEYKNAVLINMREKIEITCKKHGSFLQEPFSHLKGHGCPSCPTLISKAEQEIFDFIKEHCLPEAVQQFRIGRRSFDIRAADKLIEYHGLYWHSNRDRTEAEARRLHEEKRLLAEENGFQYVAIYEDEWRDRPEAIKAYLRNMFGKAQTAGARQFTVQEVTGAQARAFYAEHHILGGGQVTGTHKALVCRDGQIAACMSIGHSTEHRGASGAHSLSRFCTDGRSIAGAASRLFKSFNLTRPVTSYVDLDKFSGGIYEQLGFEFDSYIAPDYMSIWQDGSRLIRRHKTATKREHLAKLDGFDPKLSERENCLAMGIYRIYHSGRNKVVWNP